MTSNVFELHDIQHLEKFYHRVEVPDVDKMPPVIYLDIAGPVEPTPFFLVQKFRTEPLKFNDYVSEVGIHITLEETNLKCISRTL